MASLKDTAERVAILGWGSLLWDQRPDFDKWHKEWQSGGPTLPIEFSRISATRSGALTLVLDPANGSDCPTAYCLSQRNVLSEVIEDLRVREGADKSGIGFVHRNGNERARYRQVPAIVRAWADAQKFDAVVWTDLSSNFAEKTGKAFSAANAGAYLESLPKADQSAAFEYIEKAPEFVDTPLRKLLRESSSVQ